MFGEPVGKLGELSAEPDGEPGLAGAALLLDLLSRGVKAGLAPRPGWSVS
jgi:hypothetical protein